MGRNGTIPTIPFRISNSHTHTLSCAGYCYEIRSRLQSTAFSRVTPTCCWWANSSGSRGRATKMHTVKIYHFYVKCGEGKKKNELESKGGLRDMSTVLLERGHLKCDPWNTYHSISKITTFFPHEFHSILFLLIFRLLNVAHCLDLLMLHCSLINVELQWNNTSFLTPGQREMPTEPWIKA